MNNNVVLGASAVAVGLAVLMCMKKGDAVEDVNRRPKVAEDSTDDEAPVAKQAPTQVAEATPTPPAPTPAPTPAPAAAAPAKPEGAFAEGQFLAANQGARADVRGLVGKFVEMKGSRANVRFEDGKARSLNPDQLDVIDVCY